MVSVSVRYLFYQPVDEKIKTWTLRSPAKENPNVEKALFDWPILLQYNIKAKYIDWFLERSRAWSFSPENSPNQPIATRVSSFPQTNQIIDLILSVCCFCFVRAFPFQGHKKIPLISGKNCFGCGSSIQVSRFSFLEHAPSLLANTIHMCEKALLS